MPERYVKCNFEVSKDQVSKHTIIETVDCPKCKYKIPVENTLIDYKVLYEKTKQECEDMYKAFKYIISEILSRN